MRYAIYHTPSSDDPLTVAASGWLGRDAFTGLAVDRSLSETSGDARLNDWTAFPRRYGFHATLKAPFWLADGRSEDDLIQFTSEFANRSQPCPLGRLKVEQLGAFFALVPEQKTDTLANFAGDIVKTFEPFRAPLGDAEIARRRASILTARQDSNLVQWGYPYVFEEFRFHMTLTGPVLDEDAPEISELLDQRFRPLLSAERAIDRVAIYIEEEPGAPFRVLRDFPIGGRLATDEPAIGKNIEMTS